MGAKKIWKKSRQKVACTCRKHCDNYPAVVCTSEGGPPDWGADGLGSRNLCGKKAGHVCVEKRTGQWELLGRESGVVHGGLGWSIVMTTLCGAFQCVLLHAVVHLSAFQCKSWMHSHIFFSSGFVLGTWGPGVVHCHDYIGGAFQCVCMHAVVHLSAFQCKSWLHSHNMFFFKGLCARHMGAWGGPLPCLHCVVHFRSF